MDVSDAAAPALIAYLYDYANYAHPFCEGNGRGQREFFDQLLSESGRGLDWHLIEVTQLHDACHRARSEADASLEPLVGLFADILSHEAAY